MEPSKRRVLQAQGTTSAEALRWERYDMFKIEQGDQESQWRSRWGP